MVEAASSGHVSVLDFLLLELSWTELRYTIYVGHKAKLRVENYDRNAQGQVEYRLK